MAERSWYIEVVPVFIPPISDDRNAAPLTSEVFSGTREEADIRAKQLVEEQAEIHTVPESLKNAINKAWLARNDLCDATHVLGWDGVYSPRRLVWDLLNRFDTILQDLSQLPDTLRLKRDSSQEEYPLYNADFGQFKLGASITEQKSPED